MKTAWLLALACGSAAAAPKQVSWGWIDRPAWPAGDKLELAWLVHPLPPAKDGELASAPLELEATIGNVTRVVALDPQIGDLLPRTESVCNGDAYPLDNGELAKITFYEGGAGGYLVRRIAPDAIAVIAWELPDGACPDKHGAPAACPRREHIAAKLHVPVRAKVHERLLELDAGGARTAFGCKP